MGDGDQMMVLFQCDVCHFLNIHNMFPSASNHADELLMMCIRRVILDSMWARERPTVQSNLLEGHRYVKMQKLLGLEHCTLLSQGSFQMRDDWGVKVACVMVLRSVKFDTVRKMRTFISNYSHAMGSAFMSDNGTSARVFYSTTNSLISLWFKRFMQGAHRRMGDVCLPDKAVSRYVIRGCFSVLEDNWERYGIDNYFKLSISKAACIIITGYYGGLRGEEIGKVHLGWIREHWTEGMCHRDHPHIPIVLSGFFKGEVGIRLFANHWLQKRKTEGTWRHGMPDTYRVLR